MAKIKMTLFIACLLFIFTSTMDTTAKDNTLGILGQKAPSWKVTQWANLPGGQGPLDVGDYKGKVLYLYCFQSWCPGCHSHGFPVLQYLVEEYKGDSEVAFVAIQTTFEGFDSNTFDQAKKMGIKYELNIPIGQSGTEKKKSAVMKSYRTGGTPWSIIIDKEGIVRFNDYFIKAEKAVEVINIFKEAD